jgi:hypothetical protein
MRPILSVLSHLINEICSDSKGRSRFGQKFGNSTVANTFFLFMDSLKMRGLTRKPDERYFFSLSEFRRRYMVSPWQENGNVLDYIKTHDSIVNYVQMVSMNLCTLQLALTK